jgi:hypothetical protein
LQLLKAVFIGEGGSGDVAAHGEQGTPGEIFKQGAWGFKFWEQHAVINCFLFKGAWGSSSMRGEEQCQNDTVQNFFFIYIYFFFFICGDPKMGYNRCPLFIMLMEQHGFCSVSFIKINKTELPKLILSKLDLSETVFTATLFNPKLR